MARVSCGRVLVTVAAAALLLAACGSDKKVVAGAAAPAGTAPQVDAAANSKLSQTVLVDGAGMTLYRNTQESGGKIACTDACAKTWPPLLAPSGTAAVAGTGVTGTLATLTRPDGGVQVTFNGMPLYLFGGDKAAGDANGQGLGQIWFAVPVTGTTAAPASAGTSTTVAARTASTTTPTTSAGGVTSTTARAAATTTTAAGPAATATTVPVTTVPTTASPANTGTTATTGRPVTTVPPAATTTVGGGSNTTDCLYPPC